MSRDSRDIFEYRRVYIPTSSTLFFWRGGAALGTRQSIARGTPTYCTHYVYTVILYSNPVINIRTIKRSCLLVSGGIRMYNIVNDNNIVRHGDRTRVAEQRRETGREYVGGGAWWQFCFFILHFLITHAMYYTKPICYERVLTKRRQKKKRNEN